MARSVGHKALSGKNNNFAVFCLTDTLPTQLQHSSPADTSLSSQLRDKPQSVWLCYGSLGNAHQELRQVKSQILDKAESMLGQWSHATQTGL